MNLPIAVLAGVAGWFVLPRVPGHRTAKLDWLSGLLGSGGRPWLLSLCAKECPNPMLPLSVVTDPRRAAGYLTIGTSSFGVFGMFLFLTYQLQAILDYGALAAGLAFLPLLNANLFVSSQISRRLLPRFGPCPFWVIGLLMLACGLFLLTWLTPGASYFGLIRASLGTDTRPRACEPREFSLWQQGS